MLMPTRYAVSIMLCAAFGLVRLSGPPQAFAETAAQRKLAIVVARTLGVSNIDSGTLRRTFRGETTELGTTRLVPFNFAAGDPVRAAFDQQLLSWSPEETARYWIDRRIRGQGRPPHVVPSAPVLLAVIEKLAGAIGYLPAALVNDRVQVLRVDGASPSDSSYPFDLPP
jgi:hypothetical protein